MTPPLGLESRRAWGDDWSGRYTLKVNPVVAGLYRRVWDLRHSRTRFVFCATTGRSGTALLAHVLGDRPGCHAEHEPYPIMNGPAIEARNTGRPRLAERVYRTRKSVNIRRLATGARVYAETNHSFVRSFWESAWRDLGSRMKVVHLRRDPVSVARSMTRLGAAPGTENGNWWYLDHAWAGHRLARITPELADGAPLAHPFYRSLWYWYEVEARIREMHERAPDLPIRTLSWTRRMDAREVGGLLEWLDLPTRLEEVARLCAVRVNTQSELTRSSVPSDEELEEMHGTFRDRLTALGYDVERIGPESPGFE